MAWREPQSKDSNGNPQYECILSRHVDDRHSFLGAGPHCQHAALLAVVAGGYACHLPSSKAQVSIDLLQALFVLAVLSNVFYCAAYLVDIAVQSSGYSAIWSWTRWILLLVGTLFACVLAGFVSRGMFGYAI